MAIQTVLVRTYSLLLRVKVHQQLQRINSLRSVDFKITFIDKMSVEGRVDGWVNKTFNINIVSLFPVSKRQLELACCHHNSDDRGSLTLLT